MSCVNKVLGRCPIRLGILLNVRGVQYPEGWYTQRLLMLAVEHSAITRDDLLITLKLVLNRDLICFHKKNIPFQPRTAQAWLRKSILCMQGWKWWSNQLCVFFFITVFQYQHSNGKEKGQEHAHKMYTHFTSFIKTGIELWQKCVVSCFLWRCQ